MGLLLQRLKTAKFLPELNAQGKEIKGKKEKLRAILTAIGEAEENFELAKQTNSLRGFIITLPNVYPFNKEVIAHIFSRAAMGTRQQAERPTIRQPMKAVESLNTYPDDNDGGCVGCKETVTKKTPKLTDAKDFKQVLNFFMAGVGKAKALEKMKNFATANAIPHSHLIKAEGLAKKIFKYLNEPGQVISKETL